jgi:hypothetical protein
MPEMILRTNPYLLTTAKKYFGEDVVINAWSIGSELTIYSDADKEYNEKEKLELIKKSLKDYNNGNGIDLEDGFVLEFSSGNILEFSVSEWGQITELNFEDYRIIR